MKRNKTVSDEGEFGCIRRICRDLIYRPQWVKVGAGDDGAVYISPDGCDQVISTDTMVEGIHFTAETLSPEDVGWKLCASNFSDMAAMGAEPAEFVISAALPRDLPESWLERCYDGIRSACKTYGVNVLGGDITGSRQGVVLTGTIVGHVPSGEALLRSGAQPGDAVAVTGCVGDSAAGLDAILQGKEGFYQLKEAHRRPKPQVEMGQYLREQGATSANDISDGLSSELNEIAAASGVVLEITAAAVPLSEEATRLGRILGKDPLLYALNGGEDYQLVFTMPLARAEETARRFPVTMIGKVAERGTGAVYMTRYKEKMLLKPGGYDHFHASE